MFLNCSEIKNDATDYEVVYGFEAKQLNVYDTLNEYCEKMYNKPSVLSHLLLKLFFFRTVKKYLDVFSRIFSTTAVIFFLLSEFK